MSKLIVKPRGHQPPFLSPLPTLDGNCERWEDGFFIFLKIERWAWIITEITNPLSTRLRFIVEIWFYEPSLLKLQALQENGAQSFDVFPKLYFEKPRFFPHSLHVSFSNVCIKSLPIEIGFARKLYQACTFYMHIWRRQTRNSEAWPRHHSFFITVQFYLYINVIRM